MHVPALELRGLLLEKSKGLAVAGRSNLLGTEHSIRDVHERGTRLGGGQVKTESASPSAQAAQTNTRAQHSLLTFWRLQHRSGCSTVGAWRRPSPGLQGPSAHRARARWRERSVSSSLLGHWPQHGAPPRDPANSRRPHLLVHSVTQHHG